MNKLMQKVSATCIGLIATVLLLDYNYALTSFNTILLLLYVIIVFFTTIWTTFVLFQNILGTNTPFKANANKFLTILHSPLTSLHYNFPAATQISPVDERIQQFVDDIETTFIKKWYTGYISKDEHFLAESSKLIDIVVRRFLQTAGQINSEKILHGTVTVLLRHLKEYKKAVKRAKVDGSVEGHYRYGHLGSKNAKCFEHFALQIMSKTLRHFINWELYNSVACRGLNAILAKKLLSHIIHLVSAPGFINYKILMCIEHEKELSAKLLKHLAISIMDVDHAEVRFNPVNPDADQVDVDDDHLEAEKDNINAIFSNENDEKAKSAKIEVKTVENEKNVKTEGTEVKVHESRSANKTWRHSSDLDCISLGQDILFLSNIAEEDVKPDWSQLAEDFRHSKEKEIKEIKHTKDMLGSTQQVEVKDFTPVSVASSLVKDFQLTTSNAMHAMHKIEDEAAGVVEGILDLGMAGIRKGLRLTGLQDNVLEARGKSESRDIPKSGNKTRLMKLSHVNSDEDDVHHRRGDKDNKDKDRDKERERERKMFLDDEESESFEDIYMNPLLSSESELKEVVSPSYEGDILLEKSPMQVKIPTMAFLHVEDSPEPEYEDNVDLATTTAKLRSLLAMKTEANTPLASPSAATPSPMLVPTPQDVSGSSVELSEVDGEVDGALPSMYKAWAKTVFQNTLNTIKTALPGSGADETSTVGGGAEAVGFETIGQITKLGLGLHGDDNGLWHFEEAGDQDGDFVNVLGRFLMERQQFCVVDNAFEAVEAIDLSDQMEGSFILHGQEHKYEEELDDFDTTIPITKALVDLICELIEETFPSLVKENIVKAFLLTYGCAIEEQLQELSKQMIKCITYGIGRLPKMETSQGAMAMKIEDLVTPIATSLKSILGQWLSEDSIKSIVQLLMESLQSHKINVDTSLQILELFICEVIAACNQSSPTYSV